MSHPSPTTLLLVDAMPVMYRAFYAVPPLSTSDGRPTQAVYGFIRMFRQMRQQWQPTHAAVVFDGGLPEERKTLLPAYKAQRPPMPETLRRQVPLVETYLDHAGVRRLLQEGEEADDVIASLLARWSSRADRVLLATSDKDLFAVVSDRVRIVPVSGEPTLMGPEEIRAKTGVPPERIPEWLALVGDASDNIPGVPGVGPKTAARLLQQWGSLEAVWRHLPSLPEGKLRSALTQYRDQVERNLQMVRLRSDLDCGVTWEELALRDPDREGLRKFCEELEFVSLIRELSQPGFFSA